MPFLKANYEISYYNINDNLEPQIFEEQIDKIGVFFHMGYFGFHTNQNLDELIYKLKAKSVIIIEDVTHSLFSNFKRVYSNDFVIGSVRKWMWIPSGGFLASTEKEKSKVDLDAPPEKFISLRIEGLKKKSSYMQNLDKTLKEEFLTSFSEAEKLLDENLENYKIDIFSLKLINTLNEKEMIKSRQNNFKYLQDNLENSNNL